jgi:hypothetical protein
VFDYNNETKQQHLGSAEAIAVFKTVLVDVYKYIISENKNLIFWTADKTEQSRLKLYNTLSKLLNNHNYIKITDYDLLKLHIDVESTQYNKITNKIRLVNQHNDAILYLFAKKNSNIIPLKEVRNPSKPSDKFRLAHTSDLGYSKSYTYYSKYDINEGGDKDILDIGFHSGGTPQVTITFELNGTDKQSPQYAHLAMPVFQTVMYQVTKYINEYRPMIIKFSADVSESSRVSLYRRICKNIKDYSVEEENGCFSLTKIK